MRAPHLLRNGDRFAVGHYLVAVALDGAEEAAEETRSAPIASPAYVPGGGTCGRTRQIFNRPSAGSSSSLRKPALSIGWLIFQIRSTFRW
jgi:hypothetical protein